MRIAFGLGHPAHFHLYKNTIQVLNEEHQIDIYITDKDVLKKLLNLNNYSYTTIAVSKPQENILSKVRKVIISTKKLYKICKYNGTDLFITCLPQLVWVSKLLGKKNIFNAEDDITYTYWQGLITYPFVSTILTSQAVKTWPFTYKQMKYAGYHKLAYLHPNWFTPDENIKRKYISESHYYIIRTVNQNAYHDINAKGMDLLTLKDIIRYLENFGRVYISSERALPEELWKYILSINENDMHHILYFADLFIGDSQSMTVEAAMLGTPSIRINNFADKISIIKELEKKYRLTHSLPPESIGKIISLIKEILSCDHQEYRKRRDFMLQQKIDVTAFFVWFIENYPQSAQILCENPDFQNQFS